MQTSTSVRTEIEERYGLQVHDLDVFRRRTFGIMDVTAIKNKMTQSSLARDNELGTYQ